MLSLQFLFIIYSFFTLSYCSGEICFNSQNTVISKVDFSFCCCRTIRSVNNTHEVFINTTYTSQLPYNASYQYLKRQNNTYTTIETVLVPREFTIHHTNISTFLPINETDKTGSIFNASHMTCFSSNRSLNKTVSFSNCTFSVETYHQNDTLVLGSDILVNITNETTCNKTLNYNCTVLNSTMMCNMCTTSGDCITLKSLNCLMMSNMSKNGTVCGEIINRKLDNTTDLYEECHCSNNYEDLVQHRSIESYGFTCPRAKFYIGGFFDQFTTQGKASIEAAKMVVEAVNSNKTFFPGYEMMLSNDNKTNSVSSHHLGTQQLLDYLYHTHFDALMFIGSDQNIDLTKTIAAATSLKKIDRLQISPMTSDPDLFDDRISYRNFFQLYPNLNAFNKVRLAILQLYKWKSVGLLYSTEETYYQLNKHMKDLLFRNGITVIADESFSIDPTSAIKSLQSKGVHVILGSYHSSHSSKVYCQLYLRNMVSPWYVMLALHNFQSKATTNCTKDEVECSRRDQFFFNHVSEEFTSNLPFGKSIADVTLDYNLRTTYNARDVNKALYVYDTMYVISQIIKHASPTLKSWGKNLNKINYGDTAVSNLFRDIVLKLDLIGTTGRIRFNTDGNRYFDTAIYQRHFGVTRQVGSYHGWKSTYLLLPAVNWLGGTPYQQITIKEYWREICFVLYIVFCVLSFFVLLFAIGLFIWLIRYRHNLIIENSIWQMNLLIILGSILLLIYICLLGLHSSLINNLNIVCIIRKWCFCLGFILIVAPLLVKLQYGGSVVLDRAVFFSKKVLKKMWIMVFVLIFITVVILLLWTLLDPMKRHVKTIEKKRIITCDTTYIGFNPYIREITYVESCGCTKQIDGWLGIMAVYFFILLTVGCMYARQCRKLFLYSINDTWHCGTSMYVLWFCYVLGLLIAWLLCDYPCWFFGLLATVILLCVLTVLLLMFMHKITFISPPSYCACCCSTSPQDLQSEQEDSIMYNRYINRKTTLDDSVNSTCSSIDSFNRPNSVAPSEISVHSRSSLHVTRSKKRGNCCKRGFTSLFSCCDWCCNGTPEVQKGGWKPSGNQMLVLRGGNDKNKNFRLVKHVSTKQTSVQTEAIQTKAVKGMSTPCIVVNRAGSIDTSKDIDAGDGLAHKDTVIKKKKTWVDVRTTLRRNGYMTNYEHFRKNYYGYKNKSGLKIFSQKLDWSHVTSSLQKQGITDKRTAEIAEKNASQRRKTIAATPKYLKQGQVSSEKIKRKFEKGLSVNEGGRKFNSARRKSTNPDARVVNGPTPSDTPKLSRSRKSKGQLSPDSISSSGTS